MSFGFPLKRLWQYNTCLKFVSLLGIFGVAGLLVAYRSWGGEGAAGAEPPPHNIEIIKWNRFCRYDDSTRYTRFTLQPTFFSWLDIPSGPRLPQFRGFTITLRHITLCRTPLDGGRPEEGTCIWQHTTVTRDRHPLLRRHSNPQSLQASGRRPTLYTARPPGSAFGRKTPLNSA